MRSGLKVFLTVIGVGAVFAVGFALGYYLNRNKASLELQKVNTEINSDLEKIKLALPVLDNIRSFEGVVKSVDNSIVTIEIPSSPNPLDVWPTTRSVIVVPGTMILHSGVKTPDVLQKELKDNKKITNVFFEESISVSDIKPGWKVTVFGGDDIKAKASFDATKILFNEFESGTSSSPVFSGVRTIPVPVTTPGGTGTTPPGVTTAPPSVSVPPPSPPPSTPVSTSSSGTGTSTTSTPPPPPVNTGSSGSGATVPPPPPPPQP
ncbi:MAG: hypothetical protein WAX85_00210 [Minisyncoccia bacterium]